MNLGIIISLFLFYQQNRINWNNNYKLQFSDFKGKNLNKNEPEGKLVLRVSWIKTEKIGCPPKYKIYSVFDGSNSWLSTNHQEILNEYQFIWNLHELYIRKLRKDVDLLNKQNVIKQEEYIKVLNKNLNNFQKERKHYDGILQNQKDFYTIINKKYQDSLKMYNEYQ